MAPDPEDRTVLSCSLPKTHTRSGKNSRQRHYDETAEKSWRD